MQTPERALKRRQIFTDTSLSNHQQFQKGTAAQADEITKHTEQAGADVTALCELWLG